MDQSLFQSADHSEHFTRLVQGKLNMQPELLDDPLFLLSTAVGPNQVKWCNKGCKLNKSEESFTVSCVCEYMVTSTLQDS